MPVTAPRECEHCGASIAHLREGARYCDVSCRAQAFKKRKRAEGHDPYARADSGQEAARNVPSRPKHASRPRHDEYDKGVRVYVPRGCEKEATWALVEAKRRAKG